MATALSFLDQLLAASPSLERALPGLARAAASDSALLILGESGSGRSMLARALHAASRRAAGPLVELDPGTIPGSLFLSDLFGYRAGAFTGATQAAPGRLARAEGGTLVLDQVESLPAAVQAPLLRVLDEKRYTPLGGRERTADIRFLALGPHDLAERVKIGSFRLDLFHRLDVVSFILPPLRHRLDDLAHLIEYQINDLALRLGRSPLPLSARARSWMAAHSWPGNLRELRNVLERSFILADPAARELDPARPDARSARPRTLIELEAEAIRQALAHTRGRQGAAAEVLGISRKALWEKRKRHGIP
jgi:DNA-binding NtrC family response regulator